LTSEAALPKPSGITRIVYKEILAGDRRKFEAKSNDTPSGGGARDLRFSPYDEFVKVFEILFPTKDADDICHGHFTWLEKGVQKRSEAAFHRPTGARGNEGRIASVDKCIPQTTLPPETAGITILIIYQDTAGAVWPCFTTDKLLEKWHDSVSKVVLGCLRARRRSGVACCGYFDYEKNKGFCNGK